MWSRTHVGKGERTGDRGCSDGEGEGHREGRGQEGGRLQRACIRLSHITIHNHRGLPTRLQDGDFCHRANDRPPEPHPSTTTSV